MNRRLFKKQEFYLAATCSERNEERKEGERKIRQWIKLIENIERSDTVCFYSLFLLLAIEANSVEAWTIETIRVHGSYNELLMKRPNTIMIYWKLQNKIRNGLNYKFSYICMFNELFKLCVCRISNSTVVLSFNFFFFPAL